MVPTGGAQWFAQSAPSCLRFQAYCYADAHWPRSCRVLLFCENDTEVRDDTRVGGRFSLEDIARFKLHHVLLALLLLPATTLVRCALANIDAYVTKG